MLRLLYSNVDQRGDVRRDGANLLTDEGLETAIDMSLFTNQRADPGDDVPLGTDRGGWWGNSLGDTLQQIPGSKLWLLAGAKVTDTTVRKAAGYARAALAWLIDDGIADDVRTVARRADAGVVTIQIEIHRPDDPAERWIDFWRTVELGALIR